MTYPINFQQLILPDQHPPHTDMLDLKPLPVTALKRPEWEELYPFAYFNPIQTQLFHILYHSDHNVLLGAPTGSVRFRSIFFFLNQKITLGFLLGENDCGGDCHVPGVPGVPQKESGVHCPHEGFGTREDE